MRKTPGKLKKVAPDFGTCSKHKVSLLRRYNVTKGSHAIACPFCDIEAHGGGPEDFELLTQTIKKSVASERRKGQRE